MAGVAATRPIVPGTSHIYRQLSQRLPLCTGCYGGEEAEGAAAGVGGLWGAGTGREGAGKGGERERVSENGWRLRNGKKEKE